MAIDTIKSSAITDGTIATGDIANDAVTGTKLANDINIAGDLTVTGNDINTAGAMLLRPAGSERVNIATNGLAQFKSSGISAGNQVFQVIDDGATLFQLRAEDGNISFPQAGAGIYLGVTAGNAANLLNDYEEGTFTPVFGGTSSSPSVTYTHQIGHYTKIGNKVSWSADMRWSAWTGGSGTMELGALPFTANGTGGGHYQAAIHSNYFFGAQVVTNGGGYYVTGDNKLYFTLASNGYGTISANQVNNSSGHLMTGGFFFTNS